MTEELEVGLGSLRDASRQLMEAIDRNDPDVDRFLNYLHRAIGNYYAASFRVKAKNMTSFLTDMATISRKANE